MALQDSKTRMLNLCGPYSTKVYGSNFIEVVSDLIDGNLSSTSIIANNHFSSANQHCKNVKFLTNYAEPDHQKITKHKKDIQDSLKNSVHGMKLLDLRELVLNLPLGELKQCSNLWEHCTERMKRVRNT
jgi:hypothetical protein